jgi:hypothetical protein
MFRWLIPRASSGRPLAAEIPGLPGWLVPTVWVLLGLITVALFLAAFFLLRKTNLFSAEPLTKDEISSLWAFLGVALGVIATLIGTLLAEQNNRRTAALAVEAASREDRARKEDEKRLSLDLVAKILELITYEANYAPRARVAGAVATLIELRGNAVAIRILGDLWADDRVDTGTAVWIIDRILRDRAIGQEEQIQAVSLLYLNASKLVPKRDDPSQDWYEWPSLLGERWPSDLPFKARDAVIGTCVKVLLAREASHWKDYDGNVFPVSTLVFALEDPEMPAAAAVLGKLLEAGAPTRIGLTLPDDVVATARAAWSNAELPSWFVRLLDDFDAWAGEPSSTATTRAPVHLAANAPPASQVSPPSAPSSDQPPADS